MKSSITKATYFDSLSQIDTSEADLSDEKVLDHTYSGIEDDTFQASMIALHGSSCSADLDYLHSSTPKVSNSFYSTALFIKCYSSINCPLSQWAVQHVVIILCFLSSWAQMSWEMFGFLCRGSNNVIDSVVIWGLELRLLLLLWVPQEHQVPRWILNYKGSKQRGARGTKTVFLEVSVCFQFSQRLLLTLFVGLS